MVGVGLNYREMIESAVATTTQVIKVNIDIIVMLMLTIYY
jgi:hypothetical protein